MRVTKRRLTLPEIYAQIPPVECHPGCHACCGVVPFAVAELKAAGLERVDYAGSVCSLLGEGGCTIYEHRPFMCRIFGASHDVSLMCPYAGKEDVKRLGLKQTRYLANEYRKFKQAENPTLLLRKAFQLLRDEGAIKL